MKIDARGAVQNYNYNLQGGVSSISYTAPSPILASPTVIFNYDAVGNRTSMVDAAGRVDYEYDSLSRMKQEKRHFNDLTEDYTLSYEYDLGNALKSITDPWGGKTSYERYKSGQIESVNGSGYYNGENQSVTDIADDFQYRAWGAVKHLNNGDTFSESEFNIQYDDRLQISSFEAGGKSTEHIFDNDGRLKQVNDQNWTNFNRKFSYDQVGRITAAKAGESATWIQNPYSYSYSYNALGHLTSKQGHHWSYQLDNYSATFTNDRDSSVQYDPQGNVVSFDADPTLAVSSYNAAGQISKTKDYPAQWLDYRSVGQIYDGNERLARQIVTTGEGSELSSFRRHYIRSTVLDGRLISTVVSNANYYQEFKEATNIYADGEPIASQNYDDFSSIRSFEWIRHNPVTDSDLKNDGPHGELTGTVTDNLGITVGAEDPYIVPPPPAQPPYGGGYSEDQPVGTDYLFGRCFEHNVPLPCDLTELLVNQGAAAVESTNNDHGQSFGVYVDNVERIHNDLYIPEIGDRNDAPEWKIVVTQKLEFMPIPGTSNQPAIVSPPPPPDYDVLSRAINVCASSMFGVHLLKRNPGNLSLGSN